MVKSNVKGGSMHNKNVSGAKTNFLIKYCSCCNTYHIEL